MTLNESTTAKMARLGFMRPAVIVGLLVLGLTRIEDRAMIGVPSFAPDAMAAMAIRPSEGDGTFAGQPAGAVPLSGASQVPRERIRRALRDRDFIASATQGATSGQISLGTNAPSLAGLAGDNTAAQETVNALPPVPDTITTNLASSGPGLLSSGGNVFSASIPQVDNGGSGNGGGAGGVAGGGPTAPPAIAPGTVAAIPEPASWLLLILGFLSIGASLRHRRPTSDGTMPHRITGF